MKKNIIQVKSYAFAIEVVKICRGLQKVNTEYILSKQLMRSGTSIGANIEEAIGGQSRKDFYAKLSIAYKEARETRYWIRILSDTNLLSSVESSLLLKGVDELLKIIGSAQLTVKKRGI